jgi:hypothetical protein
MMIVWTIVALILGALQARWLWRDTRRLSWYGALGRYLMVLVLLLLAAQYGNLLAAALGWFTGFAIHCVVLLRTHVE